MQTHSSFWSRELLASEILADLSLLELGPEDECEYQAVSLADGIEMAVWQGCFKKPLQMRMRNDDRRIYLSYMLQGSAEFEIERLTRWGEFSMGQGTGAMHFTPDMTGRFEQRGAFSSVSVMVRPDVFEQLAADAGSALNDSVSSGRCFMNMYGGMSRTELHGAARALHQYAFGAGDGGAIPRHSPLWLQGQGLAFVALLLEGCNPVSEKAIALSHRDRARLMRARDILLSDLTQAPSLAELAGQSGLGLLKLKRGFRSLFGNSVYGVFLQERMIEARRRLEEDGAASVTHVAMDLGYSNASHFAAAFRKQFGINPRAIA